MGADLTVNVAQRRIVDAQRELGMREGFDVGFEMSGHPTALPEMIENMNHGGRVAMLGLPSAPIDVDWAKVVTHMLTISGIYGREMFETWNAMSAMLQSSADLREALARSSPTDSPHDDWDAAFATAREARAGKVVLDWTEV